MLTVNKIAIPLFNFKPGTDEEMYLVIVTFKNQLCCGMEEVPVVVLKGVKEQLSQTLAHLINSSIV